MPTLEHQLALTAVRRVDFPVPLKNGDTYGFRWTFTSDRVVAWPVVFTTNSRTGPSSHNWRMLEALLGAGNVKVDQDFNAVDLVGRSCVGLEDPATGAWAFKPLETT